MQGHTENSLIKQHLIERTSKLGNQINSAKVQMQIRERTQLHRGEENLTGHGITTTIMSK